MVIYQKRHIVTWFDTPLIDLYYLFHGELFSDGRDLEDVSNVSVQFLYIHVQLINAAIQYVIVM